MSRRRFFAVWLATYLATMCAILWGLRQARQSVVAEAGSPAALAAWQDWAAETRKAPKPDQPVERRPVKSDEPPLLILMRDFFLPIEAVSLAVGSFLFAFIGFLAWGIARDRRSGGPNPGRPAD
jgi:hypothetical protein